MYSKVKLLPDPVEEIWIFTKNGMPLIEFCENELEPMLLAGFISAMETIINEVTGEGLKSFILNQKKYSAIKCEKSEIIILCKAPETAKDKKIRKICDTISEIMDRNLNDKKISYWDKNFPIFHKIEQQLKTYFKLTQ